MVFFEEKKPAFENYLPIYFDLFCSEKAYTLSEMQVVKENLFRK